jgi:hypothetical protein
MGSPVEISGDQLRAIVERIEHSAEVTLHVARATTFKP